MTTKKKPAKKKPTTHPVDKPEAVNPDNQDPVDPVETKPVDPEAAPVVPEAETKPKDTEVVPEVSEPTTPEAEATPVHTKPFIPSTRDPRLPEIGAVITRQYKGQTLQVTEAGFE